MQKPLLVLQDICKLYKLGGEELYAVNHVNLKIFPGEFISLVGPSGSGKSTLMHIIGILDNPSCGKVILEGKDVEGLKEKELAKIRNQKIGFIFQSFNLLKRTSAIVNVELPMIYSRINLRTRHEIAKQKLMEVGLENKMHNHPNQLSGGQQQRVAIARALVNNPAIILADEPTGNLDSKSGDEIMKILESLHEKGHTVIIVTHDEELASQADRIIQIKDGKIVKDYQNEKNTN
jgi:putative ABC transport system ATP-binding protein